MSVPASFETSLSITQIAQLFTLNDTESRIKVIKKGGQGYLTHPSVLAPIPLKAVLEKIEILLLAIDQSSSNQALVDKQLGLKLLRVMKEKNANPSVEDENTNEGYLTSITSVFSTIMKLVKKENEKQKTNPGSNEDEIIARLEKLCLTSANRTENIPPRKTESNSDKPEFKVNSGPILNSSVSEKLIPARQDPLSKKFRNLDNKSTKNPFEAGGVFVVTNEIDFKEVLQFMDKVPLTFDGCHIGVAAWHNFDIMVARNSGRGILCDINPDNTKFLSKTLELLRKSEDRKDFIEKTCSYVHGERTIQFDDCTSSDPCYQGIYSLRNEIKYELKKDGSWLSTEKGFQHIKGLAMNDKIAVLTEDICVTDKFVQIAKLLTDNGIPIDSLYLSNVFCHLTASSKPDAVKTVETLLKPDTILIISESGELKQRATTGQTLKAETDMLEWILKDSLAFSRVYEKMMARFGKKQVG